LTVAYYVDTSALAKLVTAEPETPDVEAWLASGLALVSSDLTRTELIRAVRRSGSDRVVKAREVLDSLILVALAGSTFDAAGLLDSEILRSVDAVHIAAALELGEDLDGMVTYDRRQASAARAQGIAVVAPGVQSDEHDAPL
jgi:predicted nucleic acid-binding protein